MRLLHGRIPYAWNPFDGRNTENSRYQYRFCRVIRLDTNQSVLVVPRRTYEWRTDPCTYSASRALSEGLAKPLRIAD